MRLCWALAGLLVAGCEKPAITGCERFIKDGLPANSRYTRILVREQSEKLAWARFKRLSPFTSNALSGLDWHLRKVSITYETSSSYEGPTRKIQLCAFAVRSDTDPDRSDVDLDVAAAKIVRNNLSSRGSDLPADIAAGGDTDPDQSDVKQEIAAAKALFDNIDSHGRDIPAAIANQSDLVIDRHGFIVRARHRKPAPPVQKPPPVEKPEFDCCVV
jgi:hypothetical protein